MKLIFKKSDLNEAVSIVSKAIPTRTTMSILECIFVLIKGLFINIFKITHLVII